MRHEPCLIVLAHLFNMVRNVALLQIHPTIEADDAVARMRDGVVPDFLGNRDQQLIGHFPEAADNFQCFARALVKITKRTGAARGAEFCRLTDGGLGDIGATAYIGAGLAIGEMQNNFVNAPALIGWFIDPHLLGKLTQRGGQHSRRASERFQFLPSRIVPHRTLLLVFVRRTSCRFASRSLTDKRRKWTSCSQKGFTFQNQYWSVREWENVFAAGTRCVFAIGNSARFWERGETR